MQIPTAPIVAPLRAIERQMPGRPSLPGTDIPGTPTSTPGLPAPSIPGLPDTPYQPPYVPDTGETVPRPLMPDTNIPDTGETVPRPAMPDPGAPASPDGESGFDTPTLIPVPA